MMLIIPVVYSDNINNTLLNMTNINSSVDVRHRWNFTDIIVNPNYLFIKDFDEGNPNKTGSYNLSFNFTETNKNYNGTDFPYFSKVSGNEIKIVSNLENPINVSAAVILRECDKPTYASASKNYSSFTYVLYCDNASLYYEITLTNLILERGENIITLAQPTGPAGGAASVEEEIVEDVEPKEEEEEIVVEPSGLAGMLFAASMILAGYFVYKKRKSL